MTITKKDKVSARIKRFNKRLFLLKDILASWLAEDGYEVQVAEKPIVNDEKLSGKYMTFEYSITINKELTLNLIPYGIWILGAKGRVDVYGPAGSEKLVYIKKTHTITSEATLNSLFGKIEDGWYWCDDNTPLELRKLSKDAFMDLIDRLQ
jgi:hypothetical protein